MNRNLFPSEHIFSSHSTRILYISMVLVVILLSAGCDDNNNSRPSPTPTPTPECIDLSTDADALMDFESCPTEGLVMFCNGYGCNFYEDETLMSPPVLQGGTFFADCEVIDCFNIECEFFGIGEDIPPTGILTVDEILGNSNFTGLSSLDGIGDLAYTCSSVIAD